jgi:nucleotide-binding universal stress UspA family protein
MVSGLLIKISMQIELTDQDAEALRHLLQQKIVELDKEINRTDSLRFKGNLQQLERTYERVLGQISSNAQTGTVDRSTAEE